MNQLNSLIIEGNIVRVPEIKETAKNTKLAIFSMAVNRYYKKADGSFEQEVSYFDVEAWGGLVDTIEKKAAKGIGCRVVGRLKQNRWKGSDGKMQSKVSIVAEHIELRQAAKSDSGTDSEEENTSVTEQSKSSKFNKTELLGNQNTVASAEEELPKAAGFDIF